MKRSKPSGSEYRKSKKASQAYVETIPKLTSFWKPRDEVEAPPAQVHGGIDLPRPPPVVDQPNVIEIRLHPVPDHVEETNTAIEHDATDILPVDPISIETTRSATPTFHPLADDPSLWPDTISQQHRADIVSRGPVQLRIDFPYNDDTPRRRFSTTYYTRQMPNGEIEQRQWLVYGTNSDQIYCFCCRLFGNANVPLRLGTSIWEGLGKKLKTHEAGGTHRRCEARWADLLNALETQTALDQQSIDRLSKEQTFWRAVLNRLIDIAIYLAERNLAFRGSKEVLGSKHNGNFLGTFELLVKYDSVMAELARRIKDEETKQHYLSSDIQNELLDLIRSRVESGLLSRLRKAKYYAIILDCTPDLSHREQMSVVLRFVECVPGVGIQIKEHFFGFTNVLDTTGAGLLNSFLERAEELDIAIGDCRGQSYDNGANMKGKNSGVQARMLALNDKALFVPCCAHTLNLAVVDGAKSSTMAVTFFGVINRLYTLFSSSTHRWDILKKNVDITLKQPSDTRWESHVNCVKPLRSNLGQVLKSLDALEQYANDKKDGATASEAVTLRSAIAQFPFVLNIVIWHDILFQINKVSKLCQQSDVSLDTMHSELEVTCGWVDDYRETGLEQADVEAKKLSKELDIDIEYPEVRSRRKKRLFDYESVDEGDKISGKDKYRIDFFMKLMDQTSASLENRFEQMKVVASLYGFLFNSDKLHEISDSGDLLKHCSDLQTKMGDICATELMMELQRFMKVIASTTGLESSRDFLGYIYKRRLVQIYPNLAIALRLFLTLPVTVSSAERSFSKLKLIKSYLRSTMSDERLSALATISIESDTSRDVDYGELIKEFASVKSRRKPF